MEKLEKCGISESGFTDGKIHICLIGKLRQDNDRTTYRFPVTVSLKTLGFHKEMIKLPLIRCIIEVCIKKRQRKLMEALS